MANIRYIPDIQIAYCQYFLRTCNEEFQALLPFHQLQSRILDFLEKRKANNPTEDCVDVHTFYDQFQNFCNHIKC